MCVCPVKLDQKPPFSVSLSVSQSLSESPFPQYGPPTVYCQSPIARALLLCQSVMPECNATAPIHRERGPKVYTRCTVRAPPCTLQRCAFQTPDRNWTPLSVSLAEQQSQRWQQSLRDFLFVGATAVSLSTS